MKSTTLVLNHLLPRDSIEIGRLVTDIFDPVQHYYPTEPLSLPDKVTTTQEINNFDAILQSSKGYSVSAMLTALLTGTYTGSRQATTHITTPSFVTHELNNCEDILRAMCKHPPARAWIEQAARRKQRVYFVTGLKIVKDAVIQQGLVRRSDIGLDAQVPGSVITTAAGVGPIPFVDDILDIGAKTVIHTSTREKGGYHATGEHIFAVQYRQIKMKIFSNRQIDPAHNLDESLWKIYVATRGSVPDDETFLEAGIGDPLHAEDIRRLCEQFEVDGEEILFCPPAQNGFPV